MSLTSWDTPYVPPTPLPAWAHPPSPLWQILRQHYSPESVRLFNEAIDEVQNVPVTFEAYSELGLAPGGAPGEPWRDPAHAAWHGRNLLGPEARPQNRVDNIICGTDKLDSIVRDHKMKEIHKVTAPSAFPRCANVAHTPLAGAVAQELAGGACMLSATYYIERHGPCDAGGLHHGGFPKMRTFRTCSPSVDPWVSIWDVERRRKIERRSERPLACTDYGFDHTSGKFACYSTKATIILSDMSAVEHGPFACIPGSHKVRLASRFLLHSF